MKVDRFLELSDFVLDILKSEEHKKSFAKNMEHTAKKDEKFKDRKFSEWLMTYFAWSEVGSEEDVAMYYWNLEEEE